MTIRNHPLPIALIGMGTLWLIANWSRVLTLAESPWHRLMRDNPLLVGAGALMLGAACGIAVPETSRENELMDDLAGIAASIDVAPMTPRWLALFSEQERSGFADVAGAHASLRLPITDSLLTRFILEQLPQDSPIRELSVRALKGNELALRVRLSKPAFLPSIELNAVIEEQPRLPDSPVLVLRIVSKGLAAFATGALGSFFTLPPGLELRGEHLRVDLATLLRARGFETVLDFVTRITLSSEPGRVIVLAEVELPPRDPRLVK